MLLVKQEGELCPRTAVGTAVVTGSEFTEDSHKAGRWTRLDTLGHAWTRLRAGGTPPDTLGLCLQWFGSSPAKSFSGVSGNSASFFRAHFVKHHTAVHYTGDTPAPRVRGGPGQGAGGRCLLHLPGPLTRHCGELTRDSCPETGSPPSRATSDQAARPHASGCLWALEKGKGHRGNEGPPPPPTFMPRIPLS